MQDGTGITAVLGPTNTGKTHYAITRMLAHRTGVIGLPLRLLAREVYDKVVAERGPSVAALITGEEKIVPAQAKYFVCTVEAMPTDGMADFLAVDEIQLCADPDRGHIFTDRLLHARGRHETLFMGSDVVRSRIAALVPRVRFMGRERFSTLTYAGSKKISRLKPRSAIVAFSVDQVYAIAELIRRQRGGAAVVMGALSPRTRNAQVALYQEGDVDYLVATDAIGMGLNLDVDHIAFAGLTKFDGHRHRQLMPNEIGQIAGRAGRYTKDGTFGVTGEAPPFEPELVDAIENHRFKPLEKLNWRNSELAFGTVERLIASLETSPNEPGLVRAREAEDLASLRLCYADPEIRDIATTPRLVRLLWECCQIPDFRKVMTSDHVALVGRIFHFLSCDGGVIPSPWLEQQVGRLDRVDGDIDALSKRLAYIRTWTYVANRGSWLEDAAAWRERTRVVEDKLSDALHARLTQRFVDRRTSVLMRRLKQKERLVAEVNENGDVTVEGEFAGRLSGFRFTADDKAVGAEMKVLQAASVSALQAEFNRRADKLYNAPDGEIALTEQGGLMWQTDAIGALEKGDSILAPKVRVFVDDIAEPAVAEKVERRLSHWLERQIKARFEPMLAMQADETVTGLARGVAFQLGEALGVLPRRDIADDIKALAQEERGLLRKHGVRFGQHHIFMPLLLKPAPTRLRLVLWGLWEGFEEIPAPPPPGQVTVPIEVQLPRGYWTKAGYRDCGTRALRIDMLERLADMLRPMDARAGFEATADMLSITGCTLDQFAELMDGLGFQGTRSERPKPVRRPAEAAAEPTPDAETSATTVADAPAEDAGQTAAETDGAPAPAMAEGEAPQSETAQPPATEETVETPSEAAAPSTPTPSDDTAQAVETEESASAGDPPAEARETPAPEPAPETAPQVAEADVPPAAKEETAPAAEAASPPEPAEGVETAAPLEGAETAAPVKGAETAAAVEDAETAAPVEDAAPAAISDEIEAFYLFTLKPRGRPNRPPRRDGAEGGGRRRGGGGRGREGAQAQSHGQGTDGQQPAGGQGPAAEAERPARKRFDQQGGNRPERQEHDRKGKGGKGKRGPQDAAARQGQQAGKGPGKHQRDGQGPKQGGKAGQTDRHARRDKPVDPDSPFAILAQLKNK